jgi:hypothetical protein
MTVENPSSFPLPTTPFPTAGPSVGKIAKKVLDRWITDRPSPGRYLQGIIVLHMVEGRDVQKTSLHICTPPITTFYKS